MTQLYICSGFPNFSVDKIDNYILCEAPSRKELCKKLLTEYHPSMFFWVWSSSALNRKSHSKHDYFNGNSIFVMYNVTFDEFKNIIEKKDLYEYVIDNLLIYPRNHHPSGIHMKVEPISIRNFDFDKK